MTKKNLILFRLEGCPYCKKAEKELDAKGIKYRKIEVPKSHEERKFLKEISGQASVPVLIEVIGSENQDDDIIAWADENY